ncbi:heavy metal translocating P-type ATPase [Cohnella faecalis]
MRTIQLRITGMTCAACSARIEKSLSRMDGVARAAVSLATTKAIVDIESGGQSSAQSVIARIEKLGYGARIDAVDETAPFQREKAELRKRFFLSLLLSIPLFWGMMAHFAEPMSLYVPHAITLPFVQLVVGTVLQFYVGFPFYYGAYQALKQRTANMDTLVAISTSAAYLYSHYLVFRDDGSHEHHFLYFDTIAMVLTAILLGKWLEAIAKGKALRSLSALKELQTDNARVVLPDGSTAWVPAARLKKGDRLSVADSEWIATDGIVLEGLAEIDEALLTGEYRTIFKRAGDRVHAGTRLAVGRLIVEASSDIASTRLSRIVATVEEAQSTKPAVQRAVDRIAFVFVPVMLGIAVITFIAWFYAPSSDPDDAFRNAMAVLLVACPCALGLATPVSLLIGSSLSARAGILVKEGRFMESLPLMNTFLFDKTGTLTEGKPALVGSRFVDGQRHKGLRLAASLEQYSEHPLAKAVASEAKARSLLLSEAIDFREYPGQGVTGMVDGKRMRIGNEKWLTAHGIAISDLFERQTDIQGASILHVALEERWIGALFFQDRTKQDAKSTIRQLERTGEIWMLTGDGEQAAKKAAAEVGIERVRAGMLPEQKLQMVRELQAAGRKVVMVGDGINDTAALAASDIGFAMAGGNEAAMQAGDIVLVGSRLSAVADAIAISRRTMRNIRQNLSFALVYNAIMIPLAAFGLLDPRAACVFMAFSSVLVVGNALRLKRPDTRIEKKKLTT